MKKLNSRYRAKVKIRKTISGTTERPRLTVYRSLDNVYAQLIDDTTGTTVIATSTLSKELKNDVKSVKGKIDKGKLVGKLLAEKALEKNIKNVVFDRNGYKYHGRIRAVAEGAREGGLQF